MPGIRNWNSCFLQDPRAATTAERGRADSDPGGLAVTVIMAVMVARLEMEMEMEVEVAAHG